MSAANTRVTFGALLGMVTTAANATSQTLDVITQGVNMAQRSVESMSTKQKADLLIENSDYLLTLKNQAAIRRSEESIKLQEFRQKSPQHADLFDQHLAAIEVLFTPA